MCFITNDKLESPLPRHCYARGVFSMSSLRMLELYHVDLDDTFYETMEKEVHHSKVRIKDRSKEQLNADNEILRCIYASWHQYNKHCF